MKNHICVLTALCVISSLSFTGYVHAASVPSLSVSSITGSTQVQVTVYNGDPNASVTLYYPSTNSLASYNIGTTNASGYLLTTVDSSSRNIVVNSSVYAMVDGQQSPTVVWPNYTSSGGLPLSQTSVTLSVGQNTVIISSISASLTLNNNSNPSVAGASISGSQITVNAFNAGNTNITICATSFGCSVIIVTVQSSASTGPASISISQNSPNLIVGQSLTIPISGSGAYNISNNSNTGVATAAINGSNLVIGGVSVGTTNINICASGSVGTTCVAVNVTVTQNINTTTTPTTQSTLTFSQSQVSLVVGQSQTVNIYGPGGYYTVTNPGQNAVSASQNGNTLNLIGLAFGGSNISVCTLNNQCGNLYVYVSSNNTSAVSPSTTQAPALTSFSLSSNATTGFMGVGSVLILTLTTNQTINSPTVTISGHGYSASGTGSGPYSISYTVSGTDSVPLPISINFTNTSGTGGHAYFAVGDVSSAVSNSTSVANTTINNTLSSCPNGYTCVAHPGSSGSMAISVPSTSANSYAFNKYLYAGMMTLGQTDPDVYALQKRLKADGIYSGSVTGYFGDQTKVGVEAYQKAHGLDPIGVVGPSTRALLNQGI
jgi:hypothetical protein